MLAFSRTTKAGRLDLLGSIAREHERRLDDVAAAITEKSGGLGRPERCTHGWFVRATIFSGVATEMQIAQQEIFGPITAVIAYDTLDEAIANDTPYGLHARISGKDPAAIRAIALQLQTGQIVLNAVPADLNAPFGGTSSPVTVPSGGPRLRRVS